VTLQGIGSREGTAEGLRENRVSGFVVRAELALFAILPRTHPLGDERAAHPVGTAEGLTRLRVNRGPGNGSRRQPRGAVVVLIGAHVILFRALEQTRAIDSSAAPRTGLAKLVSTLPRLWAITCAAVSESIGQLRWPDSAR
jgi:hypothetical protein